MQEIPRILILTCMAGNCKDFQSPHALAPIQWVHSGHSSQGQGNGSNGLSTASESQQ
jgi:hypothetical protein